MEKTLEKIILCYSLFSYTPKVSLSLKINYFCVLVCVKVGWPQTRRMAIKQEGVGLNDYPQIWRDLFNSHGH